MNLENIIPRKLFFESSQLYDVNKEIIFNLPISDYEERFDKIPDYVDFKQDIFLEGIKILKAKNSKFLLLDFPLDPDLQNILRNAIIYKETESFKNELFGQFDHVKIDTFTLDKNEPIMYDLTHLNALGAKKVSEYVGREIESRKLNGRKDKIRTNSTKFVKIRILKQ